MQVGIAHHQAGRVKQAIAVYAEILKAAPDDPQALYLRGLAAQQLGDDAKAVECFSRGGRASPAQSVFPMQRGIALGHLGRLPEAVASFRKALELNPGYVEAHCNLGNVLMRMGDMEGAIASYQRALQLAPNLAAAHYNLGVLHQERFEPDQAAQCFRQAIACQPDHAAAQNNLGVALTELGRGDEAMACYRAAQAQAPDFAEPLYNMHALRLDAGDEAGAVACMEQASRLDPGNDVYRFTLGVLYDRAGEAQKAEACFASLPGTPAMRADLDAWQCVKAQGGAGLPMLGSAARVFAFALEHAKVDGLVLEFGVYNGKSIRLIASMVQGTVHGFDSFEGIPEAWNHEARGSYSTRGRLPDVPGNVQLHAGWFDASIPPFLARESGPVRLMNIDCDLYSSTRDVLTLFAKRIVPGTVLVFDEYFGNLSWRDDEYKAFHEAAREFGWSYEILCYSFMTKQAAVRIV